MSDRRIFLPVFQSLIQFSITFVSNRSGDFFVEFDNYPVRHSDICFCIIVLCKKVIIIGGEIISFFQNLKIPYLDGTLTVQLITDQSLRNLFVIIPVRPYIIFKLCPFSMEITSEYELEIRPNLFRWVFLLDYISQSFLTVVTITY